MKESTIIRITAFSVIGLFTVGSTVISASKAMINQNRRAAEAEIQRVEAAKFAECVADIPGTDTISQTIGRISQSDARPEIKEHQILAIRNARTEYENKECK